MLTLLRTLSAGYFGQHRARTALVVLSIALGVATLVATQALSKGLAAGIQEGVNPLGSLGELIVVNGQTGVPSDLADLPLQNSAVVVLDLMTASWVCFPDRPGYVQQVAVKLSDGADAKAVQAQVKERLGRWKVQGEVQTIGESRGMVSDVTAGLEIGL